MSENKGLSRELGLAECITVTAGAVIGVGLFTVGSSQVGLAGSSIIIATIVSLLLVIWPAMLYGEMGAALPLSGGTYAYAKRALGWPLAIFCSWHCALAQISVASGEALAFANYLNHLLWFLGVPESFQIDARISACALLALFTVINFRGIEFSGRLQNAFMFFFWGASTIWFMMELKNINLDNYISVFSGIPTEVSALAKLIVMVWWCYAGFESVVGLGSEVQFPQINLPRALILSPLLVFAVNALWQFFLVGLTPLSDMAMLAASDAPFVDGLKAAGIMGFPVILLCLVITVGGDFSSMIPFVGGAARYVYTGALDGCFPAVLSKVHPRFRSPYLAVLVVSMVAGLVILTDSIAIVAAMAAFSFVLSYLIGFIAYLALKWREPDLARPYRAPAGTFGAWFSIVIYLVLLAMAIDPAATWYNVGLSAACVLYIIFWVVIPKRKPPQEAVDVELLALKTRPPTIGERAVLDAQYRHWKRLSFAAAGAGLLLFVAAFVLRALK